MISPHAKFFIKHIVGAEDYTIKSFTQEEGQQYTFGYYNPIEKGVIYLADVDDLPAPIKDSIAVHEMAHLKQIEDKWFFCLGNDIDATKAAFKQEFILRESHDHSVYYDLSPLECDAELCSAYYMWHITNEEGCAMYIKDIFNEKHNDTMYGMMLGLKSRQARDMEQMGHSSIKIEFVNMLFDLWEATK